MKILLTGASGNVGTHTLPELRRQGYQVRCLLRERPANRRLARRLPDGVQVILGDIRDPAAVNRAVSGVDAVIHLAALIPPRSEEHPELAEATNVGGTRNVINACRAQARPPRLLFTSTFDVHGRTLDRPPPRQVDDPVRATDGYTAHKIACEEMIRASGLDWCVLRLTDVPILGPRAPHPIMFEIGLDNRIEVLHADDAALALVNALRTDEVWRRVLFVGGGPSCQVTYRQYLSGLLRAMGLPMLPDGAFSTAAYVTDWVDAGQSQKLLGYQRHSFDDIAAAVAAGAGWSARLIPLVRPLAVRAMLRMSPYYRATRGAAGRTGGPEAGPASDRTAR